MKKILVSALLTGLFLSTASPVFALETTTIQGDDTKKTGTTKVSGESTSTYNITIPTTVKLDLSSNIIPDVTALVTLSDLTTAGKVNVAATNDNGFVLQDTFGEDIVGAKDNQKIDTTFTTASFSLTQEKLSDKIVINTTDTRGKNVGGTYGGIVSFTFNYENDEAADKPL